MTEEQKRLCDMIDGHAAAMKAQALDPSVKIEWSYSGSEWLPRKGSIISPEKCWARLAPVPRLVPLDQSDFLGPNRVTHLRCTANRTKICAVTQINNNQITGDGLPWLYYDDMAGYECSRDNGATWGPCSKPEVSK